MPNIQEILKRIRTKRRIGGREKEHQNPGNKSYLLIGDAVLLALTYMFVVLGAYTLTTWLAPIIHTMGFIATMLSFITAILMGTATLTRYLSYYIPTY